MEVKQYQIVLVNLDPTLGSEIQKTRPCVIVSPNEINDNLRTVVIAPMTSASRKYPTRVKVKHNNQEGWVVIDQIRTIDKIASAYSAKNKSELTMHFKLHQLVS